MLSTTSPLTLGQGGCGRCDQSAGSSRATAAWIEPCYGRKGENNNITHSAFEDELPCFFLFINVVHSFQHLGFEGRQRLLETPPPAHLSHICISFLHFTLGTRKRLPPACAAFCPNAVSSRVVSSTRAFSAARRSSGRPMPSRSYLSVFTQWPKRLVHQHI